MLIRFFTFSREDTPGVYFLIFQFSVKRINSLFFGKKNNKMSRVSYKIHCKRIYKEKNIKYIYLRNILKY